MKREDAQAFANRPWARIRRAKEEYWVRERERMTLTEAFDLADSLRLSAVQIGGERVLTDRDEDLRAIVELKKKLIRAHEARRR